MTVGLTPETWAVLGDSMTQNNPSALAGTTQPWVSVIDAAIFPERSASNFGKNSDILSQMRTRYDAQVVGNGYYGIVLWGPINNFLAGQLAPAVFAEYKDIIDDAMSRGMKAIAIMTPPARGYSGMDNAKQIQLEAFYALWLAAFGEGGTYEAEENFVGGADFYLLAGEPGNPTHLATAYEMAIPDGLHQGQGMQDEVIVPTLVPLMQAPAAAEAPEPADIGVFGVVVDSVRRHYFPQWPSFSSKSNPTSSTVEEAIDEEAATLAGKLAMRSVDVDDINAIDTPLANAWCAATLKLMVAIRIAPAVTGLDPAMVQRWSKELRARLTELEQNGATVLGDVTADEEADSPLEASTHISEYDLETSDTSQMSSAAVRLRYDDEL